MANTRSGGDGSYLFGGTKTTTAPFDATGAFQGNDETIPVAIGQGVQIAGNASGAKAFEPPAAVRRAEEPR